MTLCKAAKLHWLTLTLMDLGMVHLATILKIWKALSEVWVIIIHTISWDQNLCNFQEHLLRKNDWSWKAEVLTLTSRTSINVVSVCSIFAHGINPTPLLQQIIALAASLGVELPNVLTFCRPAKSHWLTVPCWTRVHGSSGLVWPPSRPISSIS